ncbi:hypothetical protein Pla100_28830 [Neorhodopirellula pilleata]|uniref:Uncharacterized protein n=1 Tax=Neorhodopirellula pilleata TaxID=2714738 RepID=A0A5C6AB76_9BACT|nr:hypothetical protein Pla100_28830 [Neorhodopirellula pilleata]
MRSFDYSLTELRYRNGAGGSARWRVSDNVPLTRPLATIAKAIPQAFLNKGTRSPSLEGACFVFGKWQLKSFPMWGVRK